MPKGIKGSGKPKKSNVNPSQTVTNGRDKNGKFAIGNPGGPGNPGFGKSLATLVRNVGLETIKSADGKTQMSRVELVVRKAWNDAAQGNKDAREFVANRGWGKVPVQIDMRGYNKLIEQCEKESIDWQSDEILSAIIGIEREIADSGTTHQTVGQA